MGNAVTKRGIKRKKPEMEMGEGRVVHVNGLVEAFTMPMKARTILMIYPRHVICAPEQILCFDRHRNRLAPDDTLQPGHIYFLLPFNVINAEYSVTEFASLRVRLMAAARKKCASKLTVSPLERCDSAEALDALREHVALRRSCKSWRPPLHTIPESSSSFAPSDISVS